MHYPLHIQQIQCVEKLVSLYVPQPHALQQQYLALKATNLATPFPYWAKLWPSAIALATFIEMHPEYVQDKQVLELAAGVGLPSLLAASYARQVHCTDMSEESMEAAAKSAALADLQNMQCSALNWNEIDENIRADTLLLSDVNYEPEVFETLLQVIERFLQQGSQVILATPQRLMAKPFVQKLLPYGTHHQTMEVTDSSGAQAISMYVLQQQK